MTAARADRLREQTLVAAPRRGAARSNWVPLARLEPTMESVRAAEEVVTGSTATLTAAAERWEQFAGHLQVALAIVPTLPERLIIAGDDQIVGIPVASTDPGPLLRGRLHDAIIVASSVAQLYADAAADAVRGTGAGR